MINNACLEEMHFAWTTPTYQKIKCGTQAMLVPVLKKTAMGINTKNLEEQAAEK